MSKEKDKKNKLNLYLIKTGFEMPDPRSATEVASESLCNEDKREQKQLVREGVFAQVIPDVGILFSKPASINKPSWAERFFKGMVDTSTFHASSTSAVLLIELGVADGLSEPRIFAQTFGLGRYLLEDNAIEESFGLKTVLNMIEVDSIRKLVKTSVGGNLKTSSEQMPLKATMGEFGLDIDRDLLSRLTAIGPDDGLFSGTLSGGDSISLTAPVDIFSFRDFCAQAYDVYLSDEYIKKFPWFDHIKPVKDKSLIKHLNAGLVHAVKSGSKDIWMAVPEIIDWEKTCGFKYLGIREPVDDIILNEVLGAMCEELTEFEQFESVRIRMISAEDSSCLSSWPANKCLYGELTLDDKQFCISNGKWFQISKDFADDIRQSYESTTVSDFPFINYAGNIKNEQNYNSALVEQNPTDCLLMDRRNVVYGGGHSKVELCDVLTADGKLIHTKIYSGSSTLSHLFNQGLVSAGLSKSDTGFLAKANEKIAEAGGCERFVLKNDSINEVVFGIVSKEDTNLPQIPFFSKVAFHYVKAQLKMIGLKVSLRTIVKTLV